MLLLGWGKRRGNEWEALRVDKEFMANLLKKL